MKRILLKDGWDEVTTKQVRVKFKAKAFQPASSWVDYVQRNPKMDYGGRNHCERCGLRWKDAPVDMMTYFVMTDKGNKVVCQACWDSLDGTGFKTNPLSNMNTIKTEQEQIICKSCGCSFENHSENGICPNFFNGNFEGWLDTSFVPDENYFLKLQDQAQEIERLKKENEGAKFFLDRNQMQIKQLEAQLKESEYRYNNAVERNIDNRERIAEFEARIDKMVSGENYIKVVSAKDAKIAELEAQLKDTLRQDQAYPLVDVLKLLTRAADVLLHEKDYCWHDWEEITNALNVGKDIMKALESTPEQKEFICDECKFTRAPHEHRCLDPENCKCEHCNEVKQFAQTVNKQQPEAQQQGSDIEDRDSKDHFTAQQQHQKFEMKFGRHFMCILTITSNNIVVVNSAINGWGDVIPVDEISITRK